MQRHRSALYALRAGVVAAGLAAAVLFPSVPAAADSFKVLYNFCSQPRCADGRYPGGLLLDTSGNIFGTAIDVVFELTLNAG